MMYTETGRLESLYKYEDGVFVMNPHGFCYDDGVFYNSCQCENECPGAGYLNSGYVLSEAYPPFSSSGDYWYIRGVIAEDGLFYIDPNGSVYIMGGTGNGQSHLDLINPVYQNTDGVSYIAPMLTPIAGVPILSTGGAFEMEEIPEDPGEGGIGGDIDIDSLIISHQKLTGRDQPNQHPISAISGLTDFLNSVDAKIRTATSAQWAVEPTLVPARGQIIVYSDIGQMKVGDGSTIIADLPFLGGADVSGVIRELNTHINNTNVHLSTMDRATLRASIAASADNETLTLFEIQE